MSGVSFCLPPRHSLNSKLRMNFPKPAAFAQTAVPYIQKTRLLCLLCLEAQMLSGPLWDCIFMTTVLSLIRRWDFRVIRLSIRYSHISKSSIKNLKSWLSFVKSCGTSTPLHGKKGFVILTKSFVRDNKNILLQQQNDNKCFVLSTKRLVAAAKFLVAATKILCVVPHFVAVTKSFFP